MGFSDNPRVQPLKDGIVKPQGIELDCITLDPSNLFSFLKRLHIQIRGSPVPWEPPT
jgi:hypothetical protein